MEAYFFRRSVAKRGECSQASLTDTVGTGDKNRDDFPCMQTSLVMSMRYIFGDDNDNDLILILRAFHEMIKRALHDFYL